MKSKWELLDSGNVSDIIKSKKLHEDLVKFHWKYYSELAFQRTLIREKLNASLREVATAFPFSSWQRTVRYKYSLAPLSTKGSLANPGGRFNVGAISPTRYPMFAALYLAADKGTALAEVLGRDKPRGGLNPEELALTKPDSITVVSVSGKVETVVDVRTVSHLRAFVELIKTFELSPALRSEARRLGGYPLQLITSVQMLRQLFAQTNWRNWPSVFDVPAGTQVFGSIVLDAGIEGIVYKSVLTGSECLAVFPKNFVKSSSYVELDDSAPADNIPSRIDSSNFDQFI